MGQDEQAENLSEGVVIITLKSYLQQLAEEEQLKPPAERRRVPTLTAIAERAGVHKTTVSRFVSGYTQSLSLPVVIAALDMLHERGFEADLTDIVSYRPPKKVS